MWQFCQHVHRVISNVTAQPGPEDWLTIRARLWSKVNATRSRGEGIHCGICWPRAFKNFIEIGPGHGRWTGEGRGGEKRGERGT